LACLWHTGGYPPNNNAGDDDLGNEEVVGVTNEQRVMLASFENVLQDADRRRSLAVEEKARYQAPTMRQAYEM
jgi:hypothetical protein